MITNNRKITIGGRAYDPNDLHEAAKLYAQMVPDNWPGKKGECVRLYMSTSEMLAFQLRRHLAANWKKLCKTAQEEAADGDKARVSLTFKFELDHTAPSVAAITSLGMGFSIKVQTTGRPQTHDLNQGDFFDAPDGTVDLDAFAAESAEPEQEETPSAPAEPTPDEGGTAAAAAAVEKAGKKRGKDKA